MSQILFSIFHLSIKLFSIPESWTMIPNNMIFCVMKWSSVQVWWTSKHPGPFVDFAFVLENWMSDRYDVEVSHHALGDICVYARYKDWLCSKDQRLKEVGVSEIGPLIMICTTQK